MTKRDRQLQEYVAEKRVYGAEGERMRLTDEERTAIAWAANTACAFDFGEGTRQMIATLQRLLEQTQ